MNDTKHTPGPWSAEDSECGNKTARQIVEVYGETGMENGLSVKCILSTDGMFRTIADIGAIYREGKRQLDEEDANAARIVACVNKLEGHDPETCEVMPQGTAAALKAAREAVRHALEGFDALARESKERSDNRFIGYVLHGDSLRAALRLLGDA